MRLPVAILGGTFDPVHYGHLRFADDVRRALHLPQVRLLPAGDPPHRAAPHASAAHRAAMLDLGVREFPCLVVDRRELLRTGKSYTVLTLRELREEYPGRPLLLLLGADTFLGLPSWHQWRDVFELAHIVVVARPGTDLAAALPPVLKAEWDARCVDDPARLYSVLAGLIYRQDVSPQAISATAIRAALGGGQRLDPALDALLPASVLAYIQQHHLYQSNQDVA
jgi:nicotinate-nucleotide adenylyltransferase